MALRLPTASEFEDRFTLFVESIAGERIGPLLPDQANRPLNADYLLWDRSVVAELKCLTQDHFSDRLVGEKIAAKLTLWRDSGVIPVERFKSGVVTLDGLDPKYAWEIEAIFNAPLKNAVKHASSQIRKTKEVLGLPDAKGLVIVVNLGERTLRDPGTAAGRLGAVLRRHTNTLHSYFYFAPFADPKIVGPAVCMFGGIGNPAGGIEQTLLESLGTGWVAFNDDGQPYQIVRG